jgi:hypothetical protein
MWKYKTHIVSVDVDCMCRRRADVKSVMWGDVEGFPPLSLPFLCVSLFG